MTWGGGGGGGGAELQFCGISLVSWYPQLYIFQIRFTFAAKYYFILYIYIYQQVAHIYQQVSVSYLHLHANMF